ncbi:MAG: cupin domain-containing protein [Planctomycetota bacterium]|nr:cupin domain-containing protein [Planctomycetota bacterium]
MTTTAPARWLVKHLDEAPTVPCPCGTSTRPITAEDGLGLNLHVTSITDSRRHYHKICNEVYTILEGTGQIELDGTWVPVRPGSVIAIPAMVRHRLRSEAGVKVILVGSPPYREDDEYFD